MVTKSVVAPARFEYQSVININANIPTGSKTVQQQAAVVAETLRRAFLPGSERTASRTAQRKSQEIERKGSTVRTATPSDMNEGRGNGLIKFRIDNITVPTKNGKMIPDTIFREKKLKKS